ncbi:uncharacterized protein [Ptychodera flava]|uniref:uncharacterized protein n=1 Tax=Ptychodera flava TaxID=63121 RepID=UPI00396A3C74
MTFTFDEKYVNIQTKHFTKFTCSSCGKTRPKLSFDAVAYGKYAPETTEVTVKVYLCDDIKDTQTAVRKAEGDGNPNSTFGIRAKNGMCDWEISCQGSPGKDWKWQINERDGHFPRTQVIRSDDIASCCSRNLSPFAEFVFEPRMSSKWEPPNYFDVVFTLQQRPPNEKKRKAMSLVSRSMSVKFPVNEVLALNQVKQCDPLKNLGALEDAECDGAALDKVCEELKVARVRELVRRLLVNYDCKCETSLGDIEERHTDAYERKYQFMLYWQQVTSSGATYSRLCTELIHMEMRNVAEALAELWRRKVAKTTPKITAV